MKRYVLIISIIGTSLLGLVAVCLHVYKYEAKSLSAKTVFVQKPSVYFPLSYIVSTLVKE